MTLRTGPAPAPTKPHKSYRHEAFLYRGEDEFLRGVLPFVRDGISAGQPVMVAVLQSRAGPLRAALGSSAADVHFVDMAELGHNPARIIPGWRRFLDEHCLDEHPVRGIGEPIWPGRRASEVVESQLHEALLNVAVDPDTPMWLRCPYDVAALAPEVVEEAYRSHPILVEADSYAGSRSYGGAHYVTDILSRELPEPSGPTDGITFGSDLAGVPELVTRHATAAGLTPERTAQLALAVRETAAGSTAGGPGSGSLRVWHEKGALVCEVRDPGPVEDPMAGRRVLQPREEDHRGLWLANQVCDLVQVRSTDAGAVIRMVSWV